MPPMRNAVSAVVLAALVLGLAACSGEGLQELTIAEFSFPWAERPAPRTVFRAHTDGGLLHFAFETDDDDVVVSDAWEGESTVDGEDRVEIFFARDADLTDYWCIEIDPLGRVHDYHARHYRVFDGEWNCPGLKAEGGQTPSGYAVRGSIPLATLAELMGRPIGRGSELRVGLFRAEFRGKGPEGRGEADDNWISWARPAVEKPDFHVPEAFRTIAVP